MSTGTNRTDVPGTEASTEHGFQKEPPVLQTTRVLFFFVSLLQTSEKDKYTGLLISFIKS